MKSQQPNPSGLAQLAALGESLTLNTPAQQINGLLEQFAKIFHAEGVCCYLLDVSTSRFSPTTVIGIDAVPGVLRVHEHELLNDAGSARFDALRLAYRSGKVSHLPWEDAQYLSIPVVRNTATLALVEVKFLQTRHVNSRFADQLQSALQPLANIITENAAENYFAALSNSLDVTMSRDAFLSELGDLVRQATGANFAAIRELRDGYLSCVEYWGFPNPDLQRLSFKENRYEAFERAARGESIALERLWDPPRNLREFMSFPEHHGVSSLLIAPIRSGGKIFGVLSVASRCPTDYPRPLVLGFEALATTVGTALANYRDFHGVTPALQELGRIGTSLTAAEVAQGARHEALDAMSDVLNTFEDIDSALGSIPASTTTELRELLDDAANSVLAAALAIDKIKIATKPPSFEEKSVVQLRSVWDKVLEQLSGRLHSLEIVPSYRGSDPRLEVYEDWFRQIFLLLVSNSIDAFEGKHRGGRKPAKPGREIVLSVDPTSLRTGTAILRYSDNATGIETHLLTGPSQHSDLPLEQRIFTAGTSSKGKAGSGWGLFLVRRILDLHDGSIDLERYRGGVTFRIILPTARG